MNLLLPMAKMAKPRAVKLGAIRRRARRPRPGQALVLFALMMLVLMGGLGLVLDIGYDVGQRRTMQNAADAAALAGANTLSQGGAVLTAVNTVATQNGVASSSNVTCNFVNDAITVVSACSDTPPPGATGVQVRVNEQHATFILRALGQATSGTGATATAQVQILSSINGGNAPFLPCGNDTLLENSNNYFSILVTNDSVNPPATSEPARINPWAYSYDWKVRNADGSLKLLPATGSPYINYTDPVTNQPYPKPASPDPLYYIHGQHVAPCGVGSNNNSGSWKGENLTLGPITLPGATAGANTVIVQAGQGTSAGPTRTVAGVGGCGAGVNPDGCIMILPIVDSSGPGGNGNNAQLAVRMFGAFYVIQNGANKHDAYLVANYPGLGDGTSGWTTSYTGPIVITLIR